MLSRFKLSWLMLFLLLLQQSCSYSQTAHKDTVCITRTGEKYHRCNCRYLRQSSYELNLKEAVQRGYTACSVCSPPRLKDEKEANHEDHIEQEPASSSSGSQKSPPIKVSPGKTSETPATKTYGSRQCSAYTKAGSRCKRTTTSATGKCWQHE